MGTGPVPDRETYFDRWAGLHGGYDPRGNALVRLWLGWVYVVARPPARAGVAPDVVTAVGPLVGIGAVGLAAVGDAWLTAAALLVVASGLLDSVDGAVAVLTDRVTRWGQVLDHVVDRVTDLLYLAALWLAGAPGEACVAGGVLMLLQEYVRARAAAAGMTEVGVVTVWERPTRVIVSAAFLASGVFGDLWPALGAAAWVGLGIVGLGQLLVVVRRRLV